MARLRSFVHRIPFRRAHMANKLDVSVALMVALAGLAGCSEPAGDSADPGASPTGGTPAAGAARGLGVFSSGVTEIFVEMDAQAGAEPVAGPGGLNGLVRHNLEALFAGSPKKLELATSLDQVGTVEGVSAEALDKNALIALAAQHRDTPASPGRAVFHVLYVDAVLQEDGARREDVLGASLGDSGVVVMFAPVLRAAGRGPRGRSNPFVEQTTLIHELAHAAGLVNRGVPPVEAHEDTAHPHHCNDDHCVMFWANEGAADLVDFVQARVRDESTVLFTASCLADAKAAAVAEPGDEAGSGDGPTDARSTPSCTSSEKKCYLDEDVDLQAGPSSWRCQSKRATTPCTALADATDCNDADVTIYRGAAELPDKKDNDCDGRVDNCPNGKVQCFDVTDADADGYFALWSCKLPGEGGAACKPQDCDDTRASASPAASEISNGLDDDCDALVDDCLTPEDPVRFVMKTLGGVPFDQGLLVGGKTSIDAVIEVALASGGDLSGQSFHVLPEALGAGRALDVFPTKACRRGRCTYTLELTAAKGAAIPLATSTLVNGVTLTVERPYEGRTATYRSRFAMLESPAVTSGTTDADAARVAITRRLLEEIGSAIQAKLEVSMTGLSKPLEPMIDDSDGDGRTDDELTDDDNFYYTYLQAVVLEGAKVTVSTYDEAPTGLNDAGPATLRGHIVVDLSWDSVRLDVDFLELECQTRDSLDHLDDNNLPSACLDRDHCTGNELNDDDPGNNLCLIFVEHHLYSIVVPRPHARASFTLAIAAAGTRISDWSRMDLASMGLQNDPAHALTAQTGALAVVIEDFNFDLRDAGGATLVPSSYEDDEFYDRLIELDGDSPDDGIPLLGDLGEGTVAETAEDMIESLLARMAYLTHHSQADGVPRVGTAAGFLNRLDAGTFGVEWGGIAEVNLSAEIWNALEDQFHTQLPESAQIEFPLQIPIEIGAPNAELDLFRASSQADTEEEDAVEYLINVKLHAMGGLAATLDGVSGALSLWATEAGVYADGDAPGIRMSTRVTSNAPLPGGRSLITGLRRPNPEVALNGEQPELAVAVGDHLFNSLLGTMLPSLGLDSGGGRTCDSARGVHEGQEVDTDGDGVVDHWVRVAMPTPPVVSFVGVEAEDVAGLEVALPVSLGEVHLEIESADCQVFAVDAGVTLRLLLALPTGDDLVAVDRTATRCTERDTLVALRMGLEAEVLGVSLGHEVECGELRPPVDAGMVERALNGALAAALAQKACEGDATDAEGRAGIYPIDSGDAWDTSMAVYCGEDNTTKAERYLVIVASEPQDSGPSSGLPGKFLAGPAAVSEGQVDFVLAATAATLCGGTPTEPPAQIPTECDFATAYAEGECSSPPPCAPNTCGATVCCSFEGLSCCEYIGEPLPEPDAPEPNDGFEPVE